MAVTTGQISVTTTRAQIDSSSSSSFKVIVHNMSATDNLFIGDETVTASTGIELHSHAYLTFELSAGDSLYVISSGGTHALSWMKIT